MTGWIIPTVIAALLLYGLYKKVDVFSVFLAGAKEGLQTSFGILPSLIALMTCVGMFKVSGGLDVICYALSPLLELLHIPPELAPLTLLRPLSGSGALVIYEDLLRNAGADSSIGRIASVMMGSTETTFYTMAVYFGAVRVQKSRYTLPCSLTSDLVGFLCSAALVYLFFG